jgi:hypothetical protein
MSAEADAGACAMRDGAPAVLVQLVGDITELVAGADGGAPGISVDGEVLEVAEIDDERSVPATNAVVAALLSEISK